MFITPESRALGQPVNVCIPVIGSVAATETRLRQAITGNYDVIAIGVCRQYTGRGVLGVRGLTGLHHQAPAPVCR